MKNPAPTLALVAVLPAARGQESGTPVFSAPYRAFGSHEAGLSLDLRLTRRFDLRVSGAVGELGGFAVGFAWLR